MNPTRNSARVAEQIYGLLMRAYPRRFRDHYGSEMIELFTMRYDRADGLTSRLNLWMGTAWDVLSGGIALRISRLVHRQRYVGVGAAAGGGATSVTVGSACLCATHAYAGLFGAAGAVLSGAIWNLRPILLAGALVMLALAFVTVNGSAGSTNADRLAGSRTMGRIAVWTGTFMWIAALWAPRLVEVLHAH